MLLPLPTHEGGSYSFWAFGGDSLTGWPQQAGHRMASQHHAPQGTVKATCGEGKPVQR